MDPSPDSLSGHVNAIAITNDNKRIAAVQKSNLHVWNLSTGALQKSIDIGFQIETLAFDQDNQSIWLGEEKGKLFYLPDNSTLAQNIFSDSSAIYAIRPLANENRMLHVSRNGIYIWSNNSSQPELERKIAQVKPPLRFTNAVCSKDGKLLLSTSEDKRARLWNIETDHLLYTLAGHRENIENLTFNQEENLALSISSSSLLSWEIPNDFPSFTLNNVEAGARIDAIDILPDGKKMFAGTRMPGLDIWDLTFNKLDLSRTNDKLSRINTLAFYPSANSVLSGDNEGLIQEWPLGTGAEKTIHKFEDKSIKKIITQGDYGLIATDDTKVRFWKKDISSLKTLEGHRSHIICLLYTSPSPRD